MLLENIQNFGQINVWKHSYNPLKCKIGQLLDNFDLFVNENSIFELVVKSYYFYI